MENPESKDEKDDKDDNSYAKGVNEEEKGDTLMNFKSNKLKDKNIEKEYANTDPNNQDSQNNYNDAHLKTDNKIKLNQELLKKSKMNIEKQSIDDNKDKNINGEKNEEGIDIPQAFGGFGGKIFTKVNRCFSDRAIMFITIIMLLYSILLLAFSILDFIKKIKNKAKCNYFMNNILFLAFDIINITSIIIYHMMNYFLKPKLSHNILLLLICLLVIISIIRCLNYAKKNENMFALIINICQNCFTNLINGLTLYFFFVDAKRRKKDMHGIEEIINFTELNANVKTKKEEGLQLDIISSTKVKPTALVEEEVNSHNNENN
jgi:hypothetical protein